MAKCTQVTPPIFNDENEFPHPIAKAEAKDSAFPKSSSAFGAMKAAAMKKIAAEAKNGGDSKKSGGSMFGKLLQDVTNEQKDEQVYQDEKVALDIQCDEALNMASQWMQLDKDEEIAKAAQKSLEEEAKEEKQREIRIGESAALTVAIEERRRIQADAQKKIEIEKADAEFAKRTVLDDVEADHQFKVLQSKDNEVAQKLYEQLQDEMLAEELQKREDHAFEEMKAALKKEDKKRAEHDFDLARETQRQLDVDHQKSKTDQEKIDAAVALKIAITSSREDHRRRKRLEVIHSNVVFNSIQKVSSQWEEAEADVEDVAGGLCLTLLLPYLRDIKLNAVNGNSVDLEAFRIISAEERKRELDTEENSQYCAEFMIDGKNVSINNSDLSFEYSSESGLLHIYVESVHLDDDPKTSPQVQAQAQNENEKKSQSCAKTNANHNASTQQGSAEQPKTVAGKIASSFKRFFGRRQ